MKATKVTKTRLVPITLKLLLMGCLAIAVSTSPSLAQGPGSPIDSIIIGPPPPDDDDPWWDWFFDWGIKKPTVGNNSVAAPTCAHGAAWGCSKCGHIPPSRGIRDPRGLGKPSPLRSRATEVPLRHINKSRHYDAKAKPNRADVMGYPRCAGNYCPGPSCGGRHGAVLDSAAKTRSGELIDRASSIRKAPRGQNAYRRDAAGANGTFDGKVTVCERCGRSCTSCSCRGGFPTGIRVRPRVAGQKYAENCSKCGWRMFENHVCNPSGSPVRGGKPVTGRSQTQPQKPAREISGKRFDIGGRLLIESSGKAIKPASGKSRTPERQTPKKKPVSKRPSPRK